MEHFFNEHALFALFCLSFLAATLIPLGSEWLLGVLIFNGYPAATVVGVATAGNYLGACTTYYIGRWGSALLFSRVLRISTAQENRAKQLYRRFGVWSLLLSWLPIIGDPLCAVAGLFRVQYLSFSFLVIIGKLLRYTFVAWVVLQTLVDLKGFAPRAALSTKFIRIRVW